MNMPSANTIVLVRHGESEWNRDNRFCGWYDAELSEVGRAEAVLAGKALKVAGYTFDIAFTSLLTRANTTLTTVLQQVGQPQLPVARSWRLNEKHYGDLTGYNKAETAEKYGKEQVQLWRRSFDIPPPPMTADHPYFKSIREDKRYAIDGPGEAEFPTAESLKLTIDRMMPFWHEKIAPAARAGKKILIVAHGTTLRCIVKQLSQISDQAIVGYNLPNGIPMVYELDKHLMPVKPMKFLADEEKVAKAIAKAASIGPAPCS